jgi:hypothetical protein
MSRGAHWPLVADPGGWVEMPGLLNWIRASRQRKRERWEAEHGHLSEQEKFVADEYQPGREPAAYPTKGIDEQSRGRPGK